MKQVAIFMSDFHLGQRDRTEEFVADEEFSELLGRLSLEHADNKVDLVLLGDVIDLWATVTNEKEVFANQTEHVGLLLPTETVENIKDARKQEIEKVKTIVDNHELFFEALGRFLVHAPQNRRVIYVYGNHDHSLVDTDLQQEIKGKILSKPVLELANKCVGMEKSELEPYIEFMSYYKQDNLQVYGEHGNQLTYGSTFRYHDDNQESTFDAFGPECPGYVHFKTVTSRVIRAAPKLNSLVMGAFNPANWPSLAVWLLIRGYLRALINMRRFQIQYETSQNSRVRSARANMPGPWKTLFFTLKARLRSVTKDEFGDVIPKLFEQDNDPLSLPLCGHKLSPNTTKTIILGHSHGARDIDVPGIEGLKYYNTGSWILRREKNREIIEQTWVVLSTELPVTITRIQGSRNAPSLTVNDEFCNTREIKLRDPDALDALEIGQRIVVEVDAKGYALRIIRDDRTSPRIIDRQLVRRRVERAEVTKSPVTPDGARLNPLLRSMSLQVGDLILVRRNFRPYLWRLARSFSFGKLFAAIPGVIIGLVNRVGTSTYWNHIAMVYGSPSEPRESEHYNDPLIIESVPNIGVRIHTPDLQYPKEWDFAVLRLTGPLLKSWEARRLFRRITLNYLGAAYDKQSVKRGTIQYAVFATSAKGRSALGGIVIGAMFGFVLISCSALWWTAPWLTDVWNTQHNAWIEAATEFVKLKVNELAKFLNKPTIGGTVEMALTIMGLLVGALLSIYALRQLGILFMKIWVALTAAVGALLGAGIVPIMTDMTKGWSRTSVWTRYGFAFIWFSPLLLILILSDQLIVSIAGQPTKPTWYEYFRIKVTLILFSGLCIVLLAGLISSCARYLIAWTIRKRRKLKQWIPNLAERNAYPLHKQFICSGLLQDALVETARELPMSYQTTGSEQIAPNHDWNKGRSQIEQTCNLHEIQAIYQASRKVEVVQHSGAEVLAAIGAAQERSQKRDQGTTSLCVRIGEDLSNDAMPDDQKVNADDAQSSAIKETARRRLLKMGLDQIVVNPNWKGDASVRWSQARQSSVLRDTLPRHFALEQEKFKWIYLYLDQALTPNPSKSCTAQAYTDPLQTRHEAPSSAARWTINSGFTGLILTLVTTVNSKYLSEQFASIPEPLFFGAATILGVVAIYKARQAGKDLAYNPNRRGLALIIGGVISGAFAILFGFGYLEGLVESIPIIWKGILFLLATVLLAGFLFLF